MTEPIHWQSIEQICAALGEIRIGNGNYTDAGLRISKELMQLGEQDVYPTLHVVEDDIQQEAPVDTQSITVEGYIDCTDKDAQVKAHRLRADVLAIIKAMQKPRALSPPIIKITVISAKILQRPEGFPYTVCQVVLNARLIQ